MKRTLSSCMLGIVLAGSAIADPLAIEKAGQQRMLTQRLVKAYAQIGLDILPAAAGEQLAGSVKRFDRNLRDLGSMAKGKASGPAYIELSRAWPGLERAAHQEVTPTGLRKLDQQAAKVQQLADRLTLALEDESKEPASRWLNVAARQRMLCQRMVKVYMLQRSGLDSASLREEATRSRAEFSTALNDLIRLPDNSTEVSDALHELSLQWEWLDAALASEGPESFSLVIADSSESVLALSEKVVQAYLHQARTSPR